MAKKRKSDATRLDEVDRTMYTTFCSAANSLSQLYTQAMNQQKLAFQAGERHAMEKLYQWILRQHEEGSRVSGADLVSYLQHELDYGAEEASMSPRMPFQHQHHQPTMHFSNSSTQNATSGSLGQSAVGLGTRAVHSDQSRNSVFSNALSSPVRRSLQPFHLAQGGYYNNNLHSGNSGTRNSESSFPPQNRDSNSLSSNDTSMDMHADSPPHESY
ncbi:hypothetical protein H6P81_001343 [Aristolochia fimbriata]|uniref:Holocarboxylase synthetase n=1 Tax=Aristolochia fimbriata TaxID=158543 RepID=A0AAV7F9A6_ARIFI|nr:hypothetical protein H6P81_001343 [Aristolochia fimbriata]